MRSLIYLLLGGFVSASIANIIAFRQADFDSAIYMADRNYWRAIASSREALCHKRGGEYKELGFRSTFGREPDRINWQCIEFNKGE